MFGAIVTAKLSKGFVGGYEFELLLISIFLTLLILGPGKISIENYLLKREIFPKGKQLYQKNYRNQIDVYEIHVDFITYLFMGKSTSEKANVWKKQLYKNQMLLFENENCDV